MMDQRKIYFNFVFFLVYLTIATSQLWAARTASLNLKELTVYSQMKTFLSLLSENSQIYLILKESKQNLGALLVFTAPVSASKLASDLTAKDVRTEEIRILCSKSGENSALLLLDTGSLEIAGSDKFIEFAKKKMEKIKNESKNMVLNDLYAEARLGEGLLPPPQAPLRHETKTQIQSKLDIIQMIRQFNKIKLTALTNPGREVQGQIFLGAPEKYWEPSQEELALAEAGKTIRKATKAISSRKAASEILKKLIENDTYPGSFSFKEFEYFRVDVVGSGRFTYPHPPKLVEFSIHQYFVNKFVEGESLREKLLKLPAKSKEEREVLTKSLLYAINSL